VKRFAAGLLLGLACMTVRADEDSHRRLADELMGLTQSEAAVRSWRKRYAGQAQEIVDEAIRGRRPDALDAEQRKAVERFDARVDSALDGALAWHKLRESLLRIYMDTFTEMETRELVTFLKTQTGRKMLMGLPALSDGIARTVRGEVDAIRPQLQAISQDFQDEFARTRGATRTGETTQDKSAGESMLRRAQEAGGRCVNPKNGRAC